MDGPHPPHLLSCPYYPFYTVLPEVGDSEGVSESGNHAGRAVRALEERRVVSVDESAGPMLVDFNVESVREIKAEKKRRARREEIMEDI